MSVLPPLPERIARVASAEFPPQPQDSPSIGWAILGAGGIARKFTKDVKLAGSVVVAVGSRTADKAEAFAAENDVPFYGTYKDVLSRDDVDAVYVATTHNFHLEAVLEAIAAGKVRLAAAAQAAPLALLIMKFCVDGRRPTSKNTYDVPKKVWFDEEEKRSDYLSKA